MNKKIVNKNPSDLEFNYDALGNRISKIEKPRNQTTGALLSSADWKTTFYLRDAQGNVISVYKLAAPSAMTSYKQIEKHIYGSSRVGMETTPTEMIGAPPPSTTNFSHTLGNKQFEMGNHLGNVLAVVTDKKIPVDISPADNIVDYYKAELLVSTDYYPFGTVMKGRDFTSDKYRYGFNGMEKDDEMKGGGNSLDYGERMHDTRIGRLLSIDPLSSKFPKFSSYQFSSDNPIGMIEIEGSEGIATSSFVNFGVIFTFPNFDSKKNNQIQTSINLTYGFAAGYKNQIGMSTSGSLNVNFTGKSLPTKFKNATLNTNLLIGAGDNLDFKQEFTILPDKSFPDLRRNSSLGEGNFIGGGIKFDLELEQKKMKYSTDEWSVSKDVDLVATYGKREPVDVGAGTSPIGISPITGGFLSARNYTADVTVSNIFNDKDVTLSIAGSYQRRREALIYREYGAGFGIRLGEFGGNVAAGMLLRANSPWPFKQTNTQLTLGANVPISLKRSSDYYTPGFNNSERAKVGIGF